MRISVYKLPLIWSTKKETAKSIDEYAASFFLIGSCFSLPLFFLAVPFLFLDFCTLQKVLSQRIIYFYDIPLVRKRKNRKISKKEEKKWVHYIHHPFSSLQSCIMQSIQINDAFQYFENSLLSSHDIRLVVCTTRTAAKGVLSSQEDESQAHPPLPIPTDPIDTKRTPQ